MFYKKSKQSLSSFVFSNKHEELSLYLEKNKQHILNDIPTYEYFEIIKLCISFSNVECFKLLYYFENINEKFDINESLLECCINNLPEVVDILIEHKSFCRYSEYFESSLSQASFNDSLAVLKIIDRKIELTKSELSNCLNWSIRYDSFSVFKYIFDKQIFDFNDKSLSYFTQSIDCDSNHIFEFLSNVENVIQSKNISEAFTAAHKLKNIDLLKCMFIKNEYAKSYLSLCDKTLYETFSKELMKNNVDNF